MDTLIRRFRAGLFIAALSFLAGCVKEVPGDPTACGHWPEDYVRALITKHVYESKWRGKDAQSFRGIYFANEGSFKFIPEADGGPWFAQVGLLYSNRGDGLNYLSITCAGRIETTVVK